MRLRFLVGLVLTRFLFWNGRLCAVDFAQEAGEGLLNYWVAVDGIDEALESCATPCHLLTCGITLSAATLHQQSGDAVEVIGLQQPASTAVSVRRSSVPFEHGILHLEHAECESIFHSETRVLPRTGTRSVDCRL